MFDIRTLGKDDNFEDLISLSGEFFTEYEGHHEDFFKISDLKDQDVIDYFLSFCGQEKRKAFVAVDAGRIVGYITVYVRVQAAYWQIKEIGEISGLMVQKKCRRQGLAERLMGEAINFLAAQGVKYYTVYTAVANQAGLDFYQKLGLTPLYTTFLGSTK